jgi:hypothetical protein
MKTLILSVLLLPVFFGLNGQFETSRSLNLYYNTFFAEEYYGNPSLNSNVKDIDNCISYNNSALSVGYQWQKKEKQFFEAEIMPLRYSDFRYNRILNPQEENALWQIETREFKVYNSTLRFSYVPVIGSKNLLLLPGLGAKAFYYNQKTIASASEYMSKADIGLGIDFIPGIQYNLGTNIHLKFDIPITLVSVAFEREKDTTLGPGKRNSDDFGFYVDGNLPVLRLSLGCKL